MVYVYTTKDCETSARSIEQVIDDRIVIDSITAKSRAIAHAGSTSAFARTEMEAMHKSKIMNPNPRRKPSSEDTRLWSRARSGTAQYRNCTAGLSCEDHQVTRD